MPAPEDLGGMSCHALPRIANMSDNSLGGTKGDQVVLAERIGVVLDE